MEKKEMFQDEILENLRAVKLKATEDLKEQPGYENSIIQNVRYYGKVKLCRRDGEDEELDLFTVEEYDYQTDTVKTRIYLNGQEVDLGELLRDYDSIDPIKDVINEAEKLDSNKENRRKSKVYSLSELEAEEEASKYADVAGVDKKKVKKMVSLKREEQIESEEQAVDEGRLQSISHLQEIKENTKVNNYETLTQAIGIKGISKLVVVYSEDAESLAQNEEQLKNRNNSRYSFIAVMQDGSAINIDDKIALDPSKGTNSTDERIQTDSDGTTRKESTEASIFNIIGKDKSLSIEKDQFGEIQIYYGSMTEAGNEFNGTQLETQNVWPISRDVRAQEDPYKGKYHADDKQREAKKHFEHGDDSIQLKNSDGDDKTAEICQQHTDINSYISGTNITWIQFANECGFRGEGAIDKVARKLIDYKKAHPNLSNQELVDGVIVQETENFRAPNLEHKRQ